MKIYTKTGDKGTTALIGGRRVPKHSIRIEAYGTVDELNSYIGLIRDQTKEEIVFQLLVEIQDRLFTIGASLAKDPEKGKAKIPDLYDSDIEALETAMDHMNETLEPLRTFILPGGHQTVSFIHIARCVCRRAERIATALAEEAEVDERVLKYLNRLSDYLFVLSRKFSSELNAKEVAWKPRM